jgi:chromosome segregation ATPase
MKREQETLQKVLKDDKHTKELLEARKKEIALLEERISQREEKMAEIKSTLNLLEHKDEKAIADLNKETQDLAKSREHMQNEIAVLKEEKKKLQEKQSELNVQISERTNKIEKGELLEKDMMSKIEKRRDELVKLDKELDAKRIKMRKNEEEEALRVADLKRELKELEEKKRESLGTIAKTDEMQTILNRLKAEKEKLDKEISAKSKELDKIKIFIARLKAKQPVPPDDERKDQISF